MKRIRVLIVGGELGIREPLCGVLEDEGGTAEAVARGEGRRFVIEMQAAVADARPAGTAA